MMSFRSFLEKYPSRYKVGDSGEAERCFRQKLSASGILPSGRSGQVSLLSARAKLELSLPFDIIRIPSERNVPGPHYRGMHSFFLRAGSRSLTTLCLSSWNDQSTPVDAERQKTDA